MCEPLHRSAQSTPEMNAWVVCERMLLRGPTCARRAPPPPNAACFFPRLEILPCSSRWSCVLGCDETVLLSSYCGRIAVRCACLQSQRPSHRVVCREEEARLPSSRGRRWGKTLRASLFSRRLMRSYAYAAPATDIHAAHPMQERPMIANIPITLMYSVRTTQPFGLIAS